MKSTKKSTPVTPFNNVIYLVNQKEDLILSSLKLHTVSWFAFYYCIHLAADDSYFISLPCAASLGFPSFMLLSPLCEALMCHPYNFSVPSTFINTHFLTNLKLNASLSLKASSK